MASSNTRLETGNAHCVASSVFEDSWPSNLRTVGVCKERGPEDWWLGNLGGEQTFSGKTYNEHETFTTQIRAMLQPHVSLA